ncbi:MAG: alpha/beta fold hydrolase [Canibacter sp.]
MAIHTSTVGSGSTPLVFLHGLMGRGKNFTGSAKALSHEATSLLVDAPNHGASDWTAEFSYQQMADATADLIRNQFDSPVNLIGHSMGGKTAMILALTYPELISQLTIVDVSPARSGGSSEFEHLLGALLKVDLASLSSRTDADEKLREAIPEDTVRSFLLQNLIRTDHGFTWQANIKMLYQSLGKIVDFPKFNGNSFDNPVLWVKGEQSNYIEHEDFAEMNRLFPDTVPVTVRGSGHWVHAEKPQEFQTLLREFFIQ